MITSLSNERIKDIRRLKDKKEREKTGLFSMEGLRITGEAFDKGALVETLVICPDLIKNEYGNKVLCAAEERRVEILEVDEKVFCSLAAKENPQGIIAVAHMQFSKLEDLNGFRGVVIALNEVADPGNLGTIIRTADAVDSAAVILIGNCTSPYDPNAVRGSMGALFSQKIVQCNFDTLVNWKMHQTIQMVGSSDAAKTDYVQMTYENPTILLMGSERQGLRSDQMSACDEMVRIPMMRSSDSLNLAIASGVLLYEIFNQQRGIRNLANH